MELYKINPDLTIDCCQLHIFEFLGEFFLLLYTVSAVKFRSFPSIVERQRSP